MPKTRANNNFAQKRKSLPIVNLNFTISKIILISALAQTNKKPNFCPQMRNNFQFHNATNYWNYTFENADMSSCYTNACEGVTRFKININLIYLVAKRNLNNHCKLQGNFNYKLPVTKASIFCSTPTFN